MADAGPCRHPRDVSTAVRGGSSQGRRVVLPVRGAKGHGGLRRGRARRGALRGALRTVRPAWRSRSDPHRYGAEAGFLLSRAVRAVRAASAVDGDRRDPGRAGARDWRALSRPIHRRHREKSWKRRPVAVLGVLVIVLTVTTLAGFGVAVPWSPQMEAWTAA